jgi:GntR family transcriptional repressor for pyruvate dehydrogenase complex
MATKNQIIAGIDRSLGNMMKDMRVKTLAYPGRLAQCLKEHRAIYLAIQERDSQKCVDLLRQHFGAVAKIRSALKVHVSAEQ